MINIAVQHAAAATRSVAITIELCPYCGTHEAPEDRDGLLSCPNCGYPFAQDIPLIDEWSLLLPDRVESLDETSWANLLVEADALVAEVT